MAHPLMVVALLCGISAAHPTGAVRPRRLIFEDFLLNIPHRLFFLFIVRRAGVVAGATSTLRWEFSPPARIGSIQNRWQSWARTRSLRR